MSSMESAGTYLYLANRISTGYCSSQRSNSMTLPSLLISVNERLTMSCSSSVMSRRCCFTLQQASDPKHAITSCQTRCNSVARTLSQMLDMPHAKHSLRSSSKSGQGCSPFITAGFTTVQVSFPFPASILQAVWRRYLPAFSQWVSEQCAKSVSNWLYSSWLIGLYNDA